MANPFFVAGPNDDEDRIKRVMSVLTARFGPKGFHCILPVEDEEDLQEDELLEEELREFFEARGRPDDRNILGGLCSAEPESSRRI